MSRELRAESMWPKDLGHCPKCNRDINRNTHSVDLFSKELVCIQDWSHMRTLAAAEDAPPEWTKRERAVLDELMKSTGLSEHRVLLQGLRLYQLIQSGTHRIESIDESLRNGHLQQESQPPQAPQEQTAKRRGDDLCRQGEHYFENGYCTACGIGDASAKPKELSDALYAAYANHCAIEGKVPKTWHMWKRENEPKEPGR